MTHHTTGPSAVMGLAAVLLAAGTARAGDPPKLEGKGPQYVIDPSVPAAPPKKELDWRLILGSNLSLSDNRSVVGQSDGTSVTFGWELDAAVSYTVDEHEWRNSLVASAAMTHAPSVDDWVKSHDLLSAETIYLFHAIPEFGPFVRAALETTLLSAYDAQNAPVSYLVSHADGSLTTVVDHKFLLTSPLRPLALKQSLGAFVQPVHEEAVKLEVRAALGGRETVAKGQFALDDDADTPAIEVKELTSSQALGAEGTLEIEGSALEHQLTYKATAEVLVPFVHSELAPDDTRGVGALTYVSFAGALGVNVVEWASVDYELRALRDPLTVDVWQVQNNLLLTFGLTVPIPKPPADECKKK